MSTQAAQKLGLPPGLNFRPDDDELIEFFLLPRARGQPVWFPGVVVFEDDTAANTLPWTLLKRHGLDDDDEAYFFVRGTNEAKKAARQDRYCDGGGTWVSQRPVSGGACIGGEMIKWRKINLNLHMGRGKSGGGSTGWVMHEYTITEPPCPCLKICRVSFSGHGKDRKRVPESETNCQVGQPASKRARVDAAANSNGLAAQETNHVAAAATTTGGQTTTIPDQNPNTAHASPYQQQYSPPFLIDQAGLSPGISNFVKAPSYLPTQCCSSWSPSIILADEDTQLQPVQSPTCWGFPFAASAGAELYQDQEQGLPAIEPPQQQQQPMVEETNTTDHQCVGDEQEQVEFWTSIGVDTDNIVFY